LQRSIIAPAERVTNLRWVIAVFVGLGILVTASDQVAIGVSAAGISHDLGIDEVGFGALAGAFGWAYLIAQIPFGLLLDRFGVARTGRVWSACWAAISLLTIAANSFGMLIGLRVALGIAQAPALPTSAKAIGSWFPVSERSGGTAIFEAAGKLGIAIAIPLMTFVATAYGWRATFIATGVCGALYCLAFFAGYRDPAAHGGLTFAERRYLAQGGAQADGAGDDGVNAFALPKVWGLTLGFAAYSFAFYLLLTWLPRYFALTFGFTAPLAAAFGALPWLVSAIAALLVGGALVDTLIKRGLDQSLVRKAVLVCGMILGLSVSVATATRDPNVALIAITVALAGLGMSAPVVWSIPSLIAPAGSTGRVAGLMNCAGALAAIAAPLAAGIVVKTTAGFSAVFLLATVVLLAGIAAYVFILGRIEQPASARGIAI
jgi:ACS family D-galactonate transporter-like MFS transporter